MTLSLGESNLVPHSACRACLTGRLLDIALGIAQTGTGDAARALAPLAGGEGRASSRASSCCPAADLSDWVFGTDEHGRLPLLQITHEPAIGMFGGNIPKEKQGSQIMSEPFSGH